MPGAANGGPDIRQLPQPGSGLRLAGVAAVQVVENLLRLLVRDRRAKALLHLLNALLPRRTIHGRRVARYVLEAVAEEAAARGQVAPGRVLELYPLRTGRCPQQRACAGQHPRCQQRRRAAACACHASSSLTLITVL